MKFFRLLFQKELDRAYQRGFQDAKESSAKLCILTPQEIAEGDWGIEASYASRYFAERIRNQKVRKPTHL